VIFGGQKKKNGIFPETIAKTWFFPEKWSFWF
jgi:hypothetical protein